MATKKPKARAAAPKKTRKRTTAASKRKAPAAKKALARKVPAPSKRKRQAVRPKKAAVKTAARARRPRAPRTRTRESMTLETTLLASPERVYAAWIDSGEHSEFTGGEAIIDAREGGKHSAWSGYIEGRFITLEPGKRLVMSWRTTEFDESDPDSHVELRFLPDGGGTRLELVHTELPPGGEQKYTTGWREFYFVPMRKYFG